METADRIAEMGNVSTHASTIVLNNFQSTADLERAQPTKTTEPTLQCVVLMGNPIFEATRTVVAAPISIQKPLK